MKSRPVAVDSHIRAQRLHFAVVEKSSLITLSGECQCAANPRCEACPQSARKIMPCFVDDVVACRQTEAALQPQIVFCLPAQQIESMPAHSFRTASAGHGQKPISSRGIVA